MLGCPQLVYIYNSDYYNSDSICVYCKQAKSSDLVSPKMKLIDPPETSTDSTPSVSSRTSSNKDRLSQAHKSLTYLNDVWSVLRSSILYKREDRRRVANR